MKPTTKRIIREVFGTDSMNSHRPPDDTIYDYAVAQLNGENVALLFPEVHHYLVKVDMQDDHFQACLHLLEKAQTGELELPPTAASFTFDAIQASATGQNSWFVALGRLVIQVDRYLIEKISTKKETRPTYVLSAATKSSDLTHLFAGSIEEEKSGVIATLAAKQDKSNANAWNLNISIQIPGREWPNLAGIPVSVSTDTQTYYQITDAFGETNFAGLPKTALDAATLAVGPTPELE